MKPLKVPAPTFRHLSPEETDALIEAADVEWKTLIMTAARTGLRIGELLALTWGDIDLKAGQITVSKSLYQAKDVVLVQATKTNQIRYVPLEPELLATLIAHRKKLVGPKSVFCHPDGRLITRYEARRPLEDAAVKAGLKPFGWHVLRHTFASQLVIKGATLHDVQELLGHTTMTMTLRYAHLNDERKRSVVGLLTGGAGRDSQPKSMAATESSRGRLIPDVRGEVLVPLPERRDQPARPSAGLVLGKSDAPASKERGGQT